MKKVFRRLLFTLVAFAFTIGVTACGLEDLATVLPNISFEKAEVELKVNETYELSPVISGVSGSDLVEYSFDKEDYLSLSGNTITALKVGTVVVTAKLKGYDLSASLTIKVVDGTNTERTLANIPENLRGIYSNENITVVVDESKVIIRGDGETLKFDVYEEDGSYYVMDEKDGVVVKIYISFNENEGTVTADGKGTFKKDGGSTTDEPVEAEIPEEYLGIYYGENAVVTVYGTYVSIRDNGSEKPKTYTVYEDKQGYYTLENGEKIYSTFTATSVSNKYGTFTRNGGGTTTQDTPASIPEKYRDAYTKSDYTLVVYESKIVVNFLKEDKTEEYNVYEDEYGYYVYFDSDKVHFTIDDESVTINGDVYFKGGDIPATMPEELRGTYVYANLPKIVINAYTIVLQNGSFIADIYVDKDGTYYFYVNQTTRQDLIFDKDGGLVNGALVYTKEGEGGSGQGQETYTKANLSADLQGKYVGDGITVIVSSNYVVIMEATGKTNRYDLFEDKQGYFVIEDQNKVYCEFKNGSVTNKYGTFKKETSSSDDPVTEQTEAKIPADLQGTYYGTNARINVSESSVVVLDATGRTMTYMLFEDETGIYFMDNGEKAYCTFTSDSVSNKYGIFTRNNPSGGSSDDQGGTTTEETRANLEEAKQGEYTNGRMKAVLTADTMTIEVGTGTIQTFNLYQDASGIYYMQDGSKSYISFRDKSLVLDKYGILNKNN